MIKSLMREVILMQNPFSLSFGIEPREYIQRPVQIHDIYNDFNGEYTSSHTYMITGVRGSGKTVILTTLRKQFDQNNDWISLYLNPELDLLQSLAGKLASIPELHSLFLNAKINLSILGLDISVSNAAPIADLETVIERMLAVIRQVGKRVLILIDEVTGSKAMKIFAHSYQTFLSEDYPVYMVMTGLYENIFALQNDKALTFLYRTPHIVLSPLNISSVAMRYKNTFDISQELAIEMALLTKGYPFAFQVLGYLCWNKRPENLEDILPEYDQYLQDYVYRKIWAELTETEQHIITAIADGAITSSDIRSQTHLKTNELSVYRDRLIKKGLVDGSHYGKLILILPRFEEFVKSMTW